MNLFSPKNMDQHIERNGSKRGGRKHDSIDQWNRRFSNYKKDILTRFGYLACGIAWAIFVAYQIWNYVDHTFSHEPLCPYSDVTFEPWYFYTLFISLGGYTMACTLLSVKIWIRVHMSPESIVPLVVAANIVLIGLVANVLSLRVGAICIDGFNVASLAPLWGEWISCGPLLIFLTVTIVPKCDLTNMDILMMISFFVCLVFGFLIMVPADYHVYQFWLAMSCIAYLPMFYLLVYDRYDIVGLKVIIKNTVDMQRLVKRRQIMFWLSFVFPLNTVNYLFAFFGCISYGQTIAIYQLLSVTTNGLFAAVIMDLHVDLLRKAERALQTEKNANEARRGFMKYLFHEVRTPLNSITMGIDMLRLSKGLDEEEKTYLDMMAGATDFMTDTLNNVLNIQKIEEGKLELEIAPFMLMLAVQKVLNAAHGAVMSKRIHIDLNVSDKIPKKVIKQNHPFDCFHSLNFPTNPSCQHSLPHPTFALSLQSTLTPSPPHIHPPSLPTHPYLPTLIHSPSFTHPYSSISSAGW